MYDPNLRRMRLEREIARDPVGCLFSAPLYWMDRWAEANIACLRAWGTLLSKM